MEKGQTRVIAIELPEHEWKQFLAAEPRPVEWLKARIRDRMNDAAPAPRVPAS
jgi:hypothetical protein